jgi:hypothetical protein
MKDGESHLPALEGNISKQMIMDGLCRGLTVGGDMILWMVSHPGEQVCAALWGEDCEDRDTSRLCECELF